MKSIKYKILAIAIIPMLVISVILTVSHISNRMSDAEYRLTSKVKTMTRILSSSLEYGIVSGNRTYTNSILKDFVENNEVISARIYDDNDSVIAQYGRLVSANERDTEKLEIETEILRSTESINDFDTKEPDYKQKIGMLRVTASTLPLKIEQQNIIIEGVIITFLLLAITIILTLAYTRRIISPLRKMLNGIDIIRDGNVGYQIESSSIYELNVLARHINNMSSTLKEAQENILEKSDNALYAERSKALVTLESIGEGVITTDTNTHITYMNPAAEILTKSRLQAVVGKSIHKVFRIRPPESGITGNYPVGKVITGKESIHHEPHVTLVRPDNSELVIKDTASPILGRSGDVIGMALIFHDFSSIKHMSDKLAYQATHDDLTDLYNRREFESQLEDALQDAAQRDTEHALCYLDLDQFKIINDTCGHLAGDILLKQISYQIKSRIRRHDILARLGGDEFGIIFYDTNIKEAELLAEEIKNGITDFKYIWHDTSFDIGISVGLVPINSGAKSRSELLIRADSACYIAKDNGRNCIHTYAPSDRDFIRRSDELQWYNRITEALDAGNFELFCQEIRPVGDNPDTSQHYEILVRMASDEKTIWPAEFIPAAERYLLMPRIDRWVIDAFLSTFEQKALKNFGNNTYSINLSGQSLGNDEFLDYTIQRLQGKYVNPRSLTFEITETAAISNLDKALHFINTLKELGCTFALDDFGTGVSSFQYLHDLPVDYLKIDGKFVRNIDNNQINHSIIRAITEIGHELGLKIIAEYVEDEAIREKLLKCNVDFMQGYVIGKPFPLQEIVSRKS